MKYPQLVSMPSAVSDWLEEQLEARGIDSGLYTRYILSLLHAHTLDVIYPDEDLPFPSQLKKDGGRGAASNKRIRRAGPWWKHAHADAEQIKRSAAVECLMSAAEQNCEIESLVDELCEKLKEVNSEAENSSNETNQDTNSNRDCFKLRKISPKELAEQYYEAFPSLNKEENYLNANIHLVVGKWPSPEKSLNNIDLIAAKWTSSGSPKRTKRKPKRQHHSTMKSSTKSSQNRSRLEYKRVHSVRTCSREMADNRANWEIINNNNNNYEMADQCLDHFDSTLVDIDPASKMDDTCDIFANWRKKYIRKANSRNAEGEIARPQMQPISRRSVKLTDRNLNRINAWSRRQEDARRVERQQEVELLSPYEEETAIPEEYQRRTFDEESAIKEKYQRPNILDVPIFIGGRWTNKRTPNYAYNQHHLSSSREYERPIPRDATPGLDVDTGASTGLGGRWVREQEQEWAPVYLYSPRNVNNNFPEPNIGRHTPPVFRRLRTGESLTPVDISQRSVSEDEFLRSIMENFDVTTQSLMRINHSMESSAFREYVRPSAIVNAYMLLRPGPYSRPFPPQRKVPPLPDHVIPESQVLVEDQKFFIPIQTPPLKSEHREEPGKRYEDGATFVIRSDLNKVQFLKSKLGMLYIQTDFGESNQYMEFNWRRPSDDSMSPVLGQPAGDEFKPKFRISKHDKATQTEQYVGLLAIARSVDDFIETGETETIDEFDSLQAYFEREVLQLISDSRVEAKADALKEKRSSNSQTVEDGSDNICEVCDDENRCKGSKKELDSNTIRAIWDSSEISGSPSFDRPSTPLEESQAPLDECQAPADECQAPADECQAPADESQELPDETQDPLDESQAPLFYETEGNEQPVEDVGVPSQNTDTSIETVRASADRKRRHSYANTDAETWSFASGLIENCIISLPTQRLRRSVTL